MMICPKCKCEMKLLLPATRERVYDCPNDCGWSAWDDTLFGSLPPTGSDYKLMEQRKNVK